MECQISFELARKLDTHANVISSDEGYHMDFRLELRELNTDSSQGPCKYYAFRERTWEEQNNCGFLLSF